MDIILNNEWTNPPPRQHARLRSAANTPVTDSKGVIYGANSKILLREMPEHCFSHLLKFSPIY